MSSVVANLLVPEPLLYDMRRDVPVWRELPHHREPTSLEVEVLPLEAAELILAGAAVEG